MVALTLVQVAQVAQVEPLEQPVAVEIAGLTVTAQTAVQAPVVELQVSTCVAPLL